MEIKLEISVKKSKHISLHFIIQIHTCCFKTVFFFFFFQKSLILLDNLRQERKKSNALIVKMQLEPRKARMNETMNLQGWM